MGKSCPGKGGFESAVSVIYIHINITMPQFNWSQLGKYRGQYRFLVGALPVQLSQHSLRHFLHRSGAWWRPGRSIICTEVLGFLPAGVTARRAREPGQPPRHCPAEERLQRDMAKKRHQSVDRCHGSGCWLLQAPSVWELVMEELPASQRQSWHSPRHFLYRSGLMPWSSTGHSSMCRKRWQCLLNPTSGSLLVLRDI